MKNKGVFCLGWMEGCASVCFTAADWVPECQCYTGNERQKRLAVPYKRYVPGRENRVVLPLNQQ